MTSYASVIWTIIFYIDYIVATINVEIGNEPSLSPLYFVVLFVHIFFSTVPVVWLIIFPIYYFIGTINVEIGNEPSGKLRPAISKQCSGKYIYDIYESTPNETYDESTKSSVRRSTGDSRKYDDYSSASSPRSKASAVKDEEIADLQRELEQANKRVAAAQMEQRCAWVCVCVCAYLCVCMSDILSLKISF